LTRHSIYTTPKRPARVVRLETGSGGREVHNAMAMLKKAYLSLCAMLLGLMDACARGFQELHKDERINALRPPGEW